MTALRHVGIILWKDLLIDLRRKENLLAMVFFALLTLLIFQFALGAREATLYRLTPRALEGLAAQGLGPMAVEKIAPLAGRTFATQGDFLRAVRAGPGPALSGAARVTVVRAAGRTFLQEGAPGLLWIAFLLAGLLGLSKSFTQEREQGCIEGLLMTPVSRGLLYLGKTGSNALFLIVLLVLVLPLFALMFQVPVGGVAAPLCAVVLGGVIGFSALGTLLGGITSTLRGKEVLLPLLLFPLIAPVVIVVVHLTGAVLDGAPMAAEAGWIRLLAGADAVFLIVSYLVFDYVMET